MPTFCIYSRDKRKHYKNYRLHTKKILNITGSHCIDMLEESGLYKTLLKPQEFKVCHNLVLPLKIGLSILRGKVYGGRDLRATVQGLLVKEVEWIIEFCLKNPNCIPRVD